MFADVLREPSFQPISGTDFGGFVMVVLACQYGVLAWRDHEAGMKWLCAAFTTCGLLLWLANHTLPVQGAANPHALVLTFATLAFLSKGLVAYVDVPAPRRATLLLLMLGPVLTLFAAGALGIPVGRRWSQITMAYHLIGLVALLLWASRREPGAGHAVIAVALASIPVAALLTVASGAEAVMVRYMVQLPAIVFGLTLLTVSLRRRRLALQAENARCLRAEADLRKLNESLESTVQTRTAELRELVEALESFNRNVSHDLRGPLSGVAYAAHASFVALEKGDPGPAMRLLPVITREAENSERLVNALLAMARVSDATLRPKALDPSAMARDVSERLSERGESAGPRTQFDIAPMPPVQADPDLMHAVLHNLIGNAIKFSRGKAEPLVRVDGHVEADRLIVAVRDNGVGFEPAAAETLFQPFKRLHDRSFDGHGVGLSIVRRAVERHGGRVWAQAQPGVGASFFFSLPLANA